MLLCLLATRCIELYVHMMELRMHSISSAHVKFKIFLSAMEYLPISHSNLLLGACNSCCEPQKQLSENPDTLEDNGSENLQEFQDCRLCFTLHFLLVILNLSRLELASLPLFYGFVNEGIVQRLTRSFEENGLASPIGIVT
ncbi:BnaUnng04330D [Brassica napus]|uniref:(rape) hypothetical protein n=1 Tax=Brassica napus TaxID=3708 RepID=A0A078K0F0_BRANA|nr:unnamed protein product [Brassica napus]CDY71377.1 BnaUnng04330D [Brassica napus]